MTREEAIKILADLTDNLFLHTWEEQYKALHMAIEALLADTVSREMYDDVVQTIIKREKQFTNMVSVVRCKDCRHANECHKNVQYTHNEQSTITIGYTPIEWCSRGERREE